MATKNTHTENHTGQVRKTTIKLGFLVVSMFVFAIWVMPPLYDAFCDIAGLNGKTKGKYEVVEAVVDTSREIQVRFVATNNENMPWAFKPFEEVLNVHPGQATVTHFVVHNPTDKVMVAQAVPSMVPHNATDYFMKTECFCFNQQVLGPNESAELALKFVVDQEVPRRVNSIVLSYTIFDITDASTEAVEQKLEELSGTSAANNFEFKKISAYTPSLVLADFVPYKISAYTPSMGLSQKPSPSGNGHLERNATQGSHRVAEARGGGSALTARANKI